MTSVVDKYYRRIIQNIDNVRMKFDISALLVKSKEHDSKIDSNKNNIAENSILINSNENKLDNIENNIVNINTKVTNNYNINQINQKNIDFKTGIIDNQITAINSTLNDLKTKYSIENFFIYNIEIENTYTLNSDIPKFSIFNYVLVDDFRKDSILEINTRLLHDYTGYNNIGKLIHNYKLYDSENVLFHEYKSLKTNAGDNLKDDLSQIDLFYVKLNRNYDRIKIELILAMKEGATRSVSCKLYNTFNSNFLCIKYIKKN